MSETSGMLSQAYQPFLYWTQEGPIRLNSSFRLYMGNGAQSLYAFESLKLSGMSTVSFYNVYTFLPFLLSNSFFFLVLVSKFKAKY